LLIYGLVEPYSKQQEDVLRREDESNYIDLLKLAVNMQLRNRDKRLSVFSVLREVKLSCHIDKFGLELADEGNEVDLIVNNLEVKLVGQAHAERWKMRHFILEVENVIGRLKVYKKKQLIYY
jgi:hypothetical protein